MTKIQIVVFIINAFLQTSRLLAKIVKINIPKR